jgi:heat shock protein HtpX
VVLAWILAVVIRFALSRQREYLADSGSVELTKDPDAMIAALRKIEGRGELARANSAVMEMCIDNPRVGFANVFDTHPSIDARCAALVKFAGGHDPGPLALDAPAGQPQIEGGQEGPWGSEPAQGGTPQGPWGPEPNQSGKPFLPGEPPLGGDSGPWGPKR